MSAATDSDQEKRKDKIIGLFNRAAQTYDHAGPRIFTFFGERLVRFAQLKAGDRVLDIASGRGAVLFEAAHMVGNTGFVVGSDLSEAMVKETRKEIGQKKLTNTEIKPMDAEQLDFEDGSFHAVLCGFALFFFPQPEHALAEMYRVLKPGGCLAVSTWLKYDDERWKWFDTLVDKYLPRKQDDKVEDSSKEPGLDFGSIEGMQKIFRDAGFVAVQCKVEWYDMAYQDEDEWWSAMWAHGGRLVLEDIESTCGAEGLEKFRLEAFASLQQFKQAGGIPYRWPGIFTRARKPKG